MSKREVIAASILFLLVVLVFGGIKYYIDYRTRKAGDLLALDPPPQVEVFSPEYSDDQYSSSYEDNGGFGDYDNPNFALHKFDPNTVSPTEMEAMGFPPSLVKTIVNFRSKGGRFYKKEDIQKLYTFKQEWYPQFEPYIQLADSKSGSKPNNSYSSNSPKAKYQKRVAKPLDLNSATAEQLDQEWGVSPKTAQNIVKFRDKLGGFYSAEQVREVYTLPDSVYQHNKNTWHVSGGVKKININTATANELKSHPYFRKCRCASSIINYRKTHGNYSSYQDLLKIKNLKPDDLEKLKPYISF